MSEVDGGVVVVRWAEECAVASNFRSPVFLVWGLGSWADSSIYAAYISPRRSNHPYNLLTCFNYSYDIRTLLFTYAVYLPRTLPFLLYAVLFKLFPHILN